MRRKLLLLLLIPLSHIFIFTTCQTCDEFVPFYDITAIDVFAINHKGDRIDSLSKFDTLCLKLNNQVVFTAADQHLPVFSLFPAAYAKCPPNGNKGIKHSIEGIDIYSKDDYFKASARLEKLTHIALFAPDINYDRNKKYSASEFIAFLQKDNGFSIQKGMKIFITQSSPVADHHNFIIEIRQSNGTILKAETHDIVWQ